MARHESRLERAVFRWSGLAVLAGAALGLLRVWQVSGWEGMAALGSAAVTSLALLGKFVIFLGLHEGTSLTPWVLALMVWLIDLLIAYALAAGLESLEHAPLFGRWLRRARTRAFVVIRDYPGLERMAFWGVVSFVMLPLAATGAISGSFAARLLGLRRIPGILAIAIGSAGTALVFALLAEFLGVQGEELVRSPLLIGAILVLLVVGGRIAWVRITRELRKA
jgi:uncharacterized membrane protein